MKTYVVYAYHSDLVNHYVGSTYNQPNRFRDHRSSSAFCRDYPHGEFVILESDIPEDKIKEREEYWIEYCGTYEHGYNKTPKYRGSHNVSDETRQKLSDAKKGTKLTPETRQKISESLKGTKRTHETRQKISESLKGNTCGMGNKGKKHSAKSRRNMSDAHKGQVVTAETRRKLSEANKGKKYGRRYSKNQLDLFDI